METNNQDSLYYEHENTILSAFVLYGPFVRSPNFGRFGHSSRRWFSPYGLFGKLLRYGNA